MLGEPLECMKTTDWKNVRLGINPIAWSNDGMRDLGADIPLKQCLAEASTAGFAGIELGHKFPKDPVQLKQVLGKHQLDLVSGWHCTFFTKEEAWEKEIQGFRKHLELLKAMDCRVVICAECNRNRCSTLNDEPRLEGDSFFSERDWKLLIERLQEAGAIAKEAGLKLVYHHHMGMGVQTTEEIDRLMEATDPELVYLLADTGHALYAGMDPLSMIKRYASRIAHVHLKDIRLDVLQYVRKERISFNRSVLMGVFTVPGDGCIDFRPIFKALASANYSGWLVVEAEQDPVKANPLDYARKARSYLREYMGI